MQNNKPYYKHEVSYDNTYKNAVQAAKESWKQTQNIAKEAKRKEREDNKQYYEAYRIHLDACLVEACLSTEEIMEKVTLAANSVNKKTGLPYNSFLHKINYEKDLLGVVNGREIYKGAILSSVGFQMEVKKYYRKYDFSGIRFTFLEGTPVLVMTIFLEPKEKKVEAKKPIEAKVKKFEPKKSKEIITQKYVNTFAVLENYEELVDEHEIKSIVREITPVTTPIVLKGEWANKIAMN